MATPLHLADLAIRVEALFPASNGPTHNDWRISRATGHTADVEAWFAFRVDPRVVTVAADQAGAIALATTGAAHDGVRAWAFDAVDAPWRPLK